MMIPFASINHRFGHRHCILTGYVVGALNSMESLQNYLVAYNNTLVGWVSNNSYSWFFAL